MRIVTRYAILAESAEDEELKATHRKSEVGTESHYGQDRGERLRLKPIPEKEKNARGN